MLHPKHKLDNMMIMMIFLSNATFFVSIQKKIYLLLDFAYREVHRDAVTFALDNQVTAQRLEGNAGTSVACKSLFKKSFRVFRCPRYLFTKIYCSLCCLAYTTAVNETIISTSNA